MYAIIKTGGKQYRVSEGDIIYVEKLALDDGAEFNPDVLLVQDDSDSIKVGKPVLEDAKVTAKVLGQVKGEKITVFKYKAKKNQRKKQGHRQPYTRLEISRIQA